jgi:23S rRNA (uridine2552-2'-O)-methyltransferase
MNRGKCNKQWIREHRQDPFVRSAKRAGYRSRAAYKLLQLDERERIFRPGQVVVDLGAAPGGWSQVAADRVGQAGRVLALDLLPMEPLPGVAFIQGDFLDPALVAALRRELEGVRADVVMSDMAPNISGVRDADQARGLELALAALEFAETLIKPTGAFLVKAFQGVRIDELVSSVKQSFGSVVIRKPGASRDKSSEVYLLARDYGV